ncbi:hypothetical protein E1A91_A10G018000v1 [Gossypium mustelinum]|uniref:Uncharacterized protein n=2 Tax=Gossypium TaxID=3633 RepID=A0A5D2XJ82_GOSMU|nr:hypothetical protein ES288_A10G018500v1 [Gossypium darwinii]TYJ12961.1 hypothetical protein E1A91_A10G018000v1 [Gossypium mustelinum]
MKMIKQLMFEEATQGFPMNGWSGSEQKIIFNVAVGYMRDSEGVPLTWLLILLNVTVYFLIQSSDLNNEMLYLLSRQHTSYNFIILSNTVIISNII